MVWTYKIKTINNERSELIVEYEEKYITTKNTMVEHLKQQTPVNKSIETELTGESENEQKDE